LMLTVKKTDQYRRRLKQDLDDMHALMARTRTAGEGPAAQAEKVNLIREALRRIDTDEFGDCLSCHARIGVRRLSALPWAELCRTCQEAEEERMPGNPPASLRTLSR
jgi:RNA polymerase-binding transcription factor DksA